MSQYWSDFSEGVVGDDIGDQPDWENQSGIVWTLEAEVAANSPGLGGRKVNHYNKGNGSNNPRLWAFGPSVSLSADAPIDVVVAFKIDSGALGPTGPDQDMPAIGIFGDGVGGATALYALSVETTQISVMRWTATGQAGRVGTSDSTSPIPSDADPGIWWARMMVTADNEWRCKIWKDGFPQPNAWNVSGGIDSTITSGYVGLVKTTYTENMEWYYIGVGTQGHLAPLPKKFKQSPLQKIVRSGALVQAAAAADTLGMVPKLAKQSAIFIDDFKRNSGLVSTAYPAPPHAKLTSRWQDALWTGAGGTPSIVNQQLELSATDASILIDVKTTQQVVEVDWTPQASTDNRIGIALRVDPATDGNWDGIMFRCREPNADIDLWVVTAGGQGATFDGLDSFTFNDGQTYRLRFEVVGDTYKCYIDSVLVLTGTNATHNGFEHTAIGLTNFTVSGKQVFDNFACWDSRDRSAFSDARWKPGDPLYPRNKLIPVGVPAAAQVHGVVPKWVPNA